MAPRKKMPRVTKPPITPKRPDQHLVQRITLQQERLIGRAISTWSALEYSLQETIWRFIGIDVEDGRIITARLDAKYKLLMLRGLGDRHLPDEKQQPFLDLLGRITDLYDDRNFIAHGRWGTLMPDYVPAAMSLREKIDPNIGKPNDVLTETFDEDRMRAIINEMVTCLNLLRDIRAELLASRDKQPPPHPQTQ